jgi:DNA-binding transcriptional LysR family regulator
MLDVGRLRALLAVQEYGGLTAAARALSIAPPELTEQIAGLERELGVALLEGEPPGVRLTPAGRRLSVHAGRVLADLEAAGADAAAVANRSAGMLRIAVGAAAGRALLPAVLTSLRSTAPELEPRIDELTPDEALPDLATGEVDIAVIGEFGLVPRRTEPNVLRRDLVVEPLLIAVPARHRVGGPSLRLAELAGERWITAPDPAPARVALQRACAVAGFEPILVGTAADEGLTLALVAAGHGVALLPATAALPIEGVRLLVPAEQGLVRTIAAVVRRSNSADPAVCRVLEALAAAGRRLAESVPGAQLPGLAASVPGTPAGLPESSQGLSGLPHTDAPSRSRRGPMPPPPPSPAQAPAAGPAPAAGSSPPPPIPEPVFGTGPARSAADRTGYTGILPPVPAPESRPGTATRPAAAAARPEPADLPPRRPDALRGPGPTDLPSRGSNTATPVHPATPAEDPLRPADSAEPARSFPTSPDLGVRALTSAELPPRSRPGPADPAAASLPRRSRADSRGTAHNGSADRSLGTLPPAPPGSDEDVRLSIFEELQSEWFRRTTSGDSSAPPPAWQSPADEGWRAAARLSEPAIAGTTTSGLPKRVPQALYVPGAVGPPAPAPAAPPTPPPRQRSAQEVRGRLATYRDGVRRGRHAERNRPEDADH